MKTIPFTTVCLLGLASLCTLPALQAAVDYESARYVEFKALKGNYDDAKKWENKQVPGIKENAAFKMAGSVATLSSPVPLVNGVLVGASGAGASLYITEGAQLTFKAYLRAYSNMANTKGFIDMTGGKVDSEFGLLRVGTSATFSAQGVMTISGGTLRCGIYVGEIAAAKGSGLLVVKGARANIAAAEKSPGGFIDETGAVEFVLDETGVSPIDFSTRTFKFSKGSAIRVDASAYTGPTKRIPLILAAKWIAVENAALSVSAQPKNGTATVEIGKIGKQNAVFLNVSAKP